MPYARVGKKDSGNVELYYEDHSSGRAVVPCFLAGQVELNSLAVF